MYIYSTYHHMVMVSATAWRWLRKRSKAKLWNVFTWGTGWHGGVLCRSSICGNVEPWGWRGWTSQPKMCQDVPRCGPQFGWNHFSLEGFTMFYPGQLPTLGPQKVWIYWLRSWEPLWRSDPFQIHFKSSSSSSYCWAWPPYFSNSVLGKNIEKHQWLKADDITNARHECQKRQWSVASGGLHLPPEIEAATFTAADRPRRNGRPGRHLKYVVLMINTPHPGKSFILHGCQPVASSTWSEYVSMQE